jgi:hypothetical protein
MLFITVLGDILMLLLLRRNVFEKKSNFQEAQANHNNSWLMICSQGRQEFQSSEVRLCEQKK